MPVVILLTRITASGMMMVHGVAKFNKLLAGGEIKFYDFLYLGPKISLVLTVIGELVAPAFIMLGLFTRYASALVAFTMFVAAFMVHAGDPFDDREASLTYLLLFMMFVITGAGRFGLDTLREKQRAD